MELDQLRASQARWAGFKMFYYHGVGDADRLWGRLAGEEQMPVVHLRRRNGLRTAASRKLAMASKDWVRGASNSAEPPEDKRVTFTANELRADFEKTRDYETRFTQMFAAHPNLDIEYSDLSADPFGTCRTITDLLGLPPLPDVAEVRTQKQNPEPLPLLIENYQELSREFAGTPWAAFFDESA
jgi:LPS sulfotransferase NodH